MVNRFKIPTIFICQKFILQTKYQNHEFVGYGNLDDKFAFIVLPGFRPENVPNFRIIKSNTGDVFISLKDINKECIDNIENSIKNKISIEEYLENFVMPPKTNYKKKKPLIIDSESESPKVIKPKKKKIIIEETKPVTVNKPLTINTSASRKIKIKGDPKNKSRRNPVIKKRRIIIADSDI